MPSLIVFVFGTIIGSFLNVCIFRIPKGESVVWPGSHCLACGHPIAWYDNVPVVSFFALKGRCRHCRTKISWRYVFVEIFTALIFVLFYRQFGLSIKGLVYFLLSLALIVESAIDLQHEIIPDVITLPGILIGLLVSALFPALQDETMWTAGLFKSFIGVLVGGGFLYASAVAAEFVLKKEAMGGGDVKLLGMLGAFLGWRGCLWTIFVSSLIGSVIGIYLRLKNGQRQIPFGPYLAAAAVLYVFFGEKVMAWYWHITG